MTASPISAAGRRCRSRVSRGYRERNPVSFAMFTSCPRQGATLVTDDAVNRPKSQRAVSFVYVFAVVLLNPSGVDTTTWVALP